METQSKPLQTGYTAHDLLGMETQGAYKAHQITDKIIASVALDRVIYSIKAAWSGMNELASHVYGITIGAGSVRVHLHSARDLEQIPGNAMFRAYGKQSNGFKGEMLKEYDGVEFFYLVNADAARDKKEGKN